jgi:hypothetical protein
MTHQTQNPLPSDRSFGLTFAVVFALIGAWMAWKGSATWIAALALAAIFLVAAFLFPKVLHPLNIAWMWLGSLLNRVVYLPERDPDEGSKDNYLNPKF